MDTPEFTHVLVISHNGNTTAQRHDAYAPHVGDTIEAMASYSHAEGGFRVSGHLSWELEFQTAEETHDAEFDAFKSAMIAAGAFEESPEASPEMKLMAGERVPVTLLKHDSANVAAG